MCPSTYFPLWVSTHLVCDNINFSIFPLLELSISQQISPLVPCFVFRVMVLHATLLVTFPSILLVQRNQAMTLFIHASHVLSQIQQESVCHNVYSNTWLTITTLHARESVVVLRNLILFYCFKDSICNCLSKWMPIKKLITLLHFYTTNKRLNP